MQHELPTRRRFLRACGLAGLAALAAPLLPAPVLSAAHAAEERSKGLLKATRTEPLMGTFVTLTVLHDSRFLAEEAMGRAFARMRELIGVFNRFDSASPLSALNAEGRLADAPPELAGLLAEARSLHSLTGGAFDPTVKPIIDLFRERATEDGRVFHLSRAEREDLLALVGMDGVALSGRSVRFARAGMGLTLDGVAKGYIADMASSTLSDLGAKNHLVNAGGDIRVCSDERREKPWTIAVQSPEGAGSPALVHLRNGAVATSGSYEVAFDNRLVHHHIVDPRTALSPAQTASATVTADTVMQADALATAVFVLPPRDGFELVDALPGSEALIITANGTTLPTRKWDTARG